MTRLLRELFRVAPCAEIARLRTELAAAREELAAELAAGTRLHKLCTPLSEPLALQPLLVEILSATVALQNADFGDIRLYDAKTDTLTVAALRGTSQELLQHLGYSLGATAAYGAALQRRERVVIHDVEREPGFASSLHLGGNGHFRALQSTPLFGHRGEALGVLSTHFRQPHRPNERELRHTDLCARQASASIERQRAEERLRRMECYLAQAQRLSGAGRCELDAGTGKLLASPEYSRIFGFEPTDQARPHEEFLQRIDPEDRPAIVREVEAAVLNHADFDLRYRIILPNGSLRHVHALGHCCYAETGNPNEYIGSAIDVTRQSQGDEDQCKLTSLIAHSADFIGMASPEGDAVFINPAGQRLVGIHSDEAVRGTQIHDYVLEEDRPIIEAEMLKAAMQDGGWRGELRFRHFETGAPIPMLVNCFFIKEPGTGRKIALATISRDISERKKREETLREYEKVVEGLEEMITVVDRDYRYRLANRAFLEYRGLTKEMLIGRPAPEMLNPGVFDSVVKEKLDQAFAGQNVHYEIRYHYHLRGERDLSISYFPIEGPGGIDRVGCVFQDITERNRVEARLRRSEAYLAEGQRMSHTGSWAWNPASGEIFWSEEHYRIFGFEPGAVKPTLELFFSFVRRDERATVRQAFERSLATKTKYEAFFRICRPDGNVRYVHALAHPAFDESGTVLEYVGTVIDITEQQQAEEALQKLRTELAHVTRVTMMGELTASIAHELNQPLGAIVNNGNACLGILQLPRAQLTEDEMRVALADIVSDANRASGIIARIRALARRAPPENVWLSAQEVIADVMALSERELAGRGIATQIYIAPDLPLVFADRIELQQVLLNLLINALEAMSGLSKERCVLSVRAEPHDLERQRMVAISIHDLGSGVGAVDPERLFEAFYTTKPEGMGMGLRISRSIVEACGGRLWAMPNIGGGMTFFCALPAGTSSAL